MKSLAERKAQRAQQRSENLKDAPLQDTGITQEPGTNADDGKAYADMTIDELKAAAKSLGGEVPKDKTVKADILEYVQNLAKFKAEADDEGSAETGNGAGWKAAN